MAYSKFSYKTVKQQLGIYNKYDNLFVDLQAVAPSDWLKMTTQQAGRIALYSEKARSEGIVFPILLEITKRNENKISLYSGAILNADMSLELSEECDFILSKGAQDFDLDTPLFCMIEAEDNDIEKNIPQCIAQMEGARIYNEKEGKSLPEIYGCVTTGTEWQFLKLVHKTCWIDTNRFHIVKLEEVLGALQHIVNQSLD